MTLFLFSQPAAYSYDPFDLSAFQAATVNWTEQYSDGAEISLNTPFGNYRVSGNFQNFVEGDWPESGEITRIRLGSNNLIFDTPLSLETFLQWVEDGDGAAFADFLYGRDDHFRFSANSAGMTVNGHDGDDLFESYVSGGGFTFDGGAGSDTAMFWTVSSGVVIDLEIETQQDMSGAGLNTFVSIENLVGSLYHDDILRGTAGANVLEGAGGNDTLDGRGGTDTASYERAYQAVTVSLAIAGAQDTVGAGVDTLISLENLRGSAYDDDLTGDGGANLIEGLDGDDILDGGAGDDTIDGGAGQDSARFSAPATVNLGITSPQATGQGMDTFISIENLIGSAGDDQLTGDGEDNVIDGRAGDDVLDGAGGFDTVSYASAPGGVQVDMSITGAQDTLGAGSDTLSNFEEVAGSDFDDVLSGDDLDNTLSGGLGDDELAGRGGGDILNGGAGDDLLAGGEGDDVLNGGDDRDTATYADAAGAVTVDLRLTVAQNTGQGMDTLTGVEDLIGSDFDDQLTAGSAGPYGLSGGAGDDVLAVGVGLANHFDGGDGIDTVSYANTGISVAGIWLQVNLGTGFVSTSSIDHSSRNAFISIENLSGTPYNDRLTGDDGANTLWGQDGTDELYGAGGDDILIGGAGNDLMDGGDGIDTADFSEATAFVTVNLSITTQQFTGTGDTHHDTLTNIENLRGSAFDDTLSGDSGENTLWGEDGDDVLKGGGGDDVLNGGAGLDIADYAAAGQAINIDLTLAGPFSVGSEGTDTLVSIEGLIGSAFADTLSGDGNDNVLGGRDGDDELTGRDGDDTLRGGAGLDLLIGGAGDDNLDGGAGVDTASYAGAGAGVAVDLSVGSAQDTVGAGVDTLAAIENLLGSDYDDTLGGDGGANHLDGGLGDDVLSGAGGGDELLGGDGDDELAGGDGDDLLVGGAGNDRLDGGSGVDTADLSDGATFMDIDLTLTTAQNAGDIGMDTFISIENLIAGSGNDRLSGTSGANILRGGEGNDTLIGAGGTDTLEGGAGTDTVSFAWATFGVQVSLLVGGSQTIAAGNSNTISGIENIIGTVFDDQLTGDGQDNELRGEDGDDVLQGGAGNDILHGGLGRDLADYSGAASGVQVNLAVTAAQNTIGAGQDTLSGFEDLRGSAFNDTLNGDGQDNVIEGGAGNDSLNGRGGFDFASYASATSAVQVNLAVAGAQDTGGAGFDTLAGFEGLIGSNHGDDLRGDGQDNIIRGGGGGDSLYGQGGDDILDGGTGTNNLFGGSGIDTASYASAYTGVTVDLIIVGLQDTGVSNDSLDSIENLTGSDFDDILAGNSQDNTISGGDGDDFLLGDTGDDVLIGGAGNDMASYYYAPGGVTVDLRITGAQNTGADGIDTLVSIEDLAGSEFNDVLIGDDGSNYLVGDLGDDTLTGGANVDYARFLGQSTQYAISTVGDVVTITGPDGTDTLTGIEYLIFDNGFYHWRPGVGQEIDFGDDPDTFMSQIRDFDGNDLGSPNSWNLIGSVDIQGDGDLEYLFFNRDNGRWATVGPAEDGLVYFDDHGWAGDTRVVGIYIDPLVQSGDVEQGGPHDSQRRFQNDINIGNIAGILGADDYDGDGLQEVYFSLTDGTAYLHAYMHADGNIRYANYQNQQQVIDYLTDNGYSADTWDGWFDGASSLVVGQDDFVGG